VKIQIYIVKILLNFAKKRKNKMKNLDDTLVFVACVSVPMFVLLDLAKLKERQGKKILLTNFCVTAFLFLLFDLFEVRQEIDEEHMLIKNPSYKILFMIRMILVYEIFWCLMIPIFNCAAYYSCNAERVSQDTLKTLLSVSWLISVGTGILCALLNKKLYQILYLYNVFGALLASFLTVKVPYEKGRVYEIEKGGIFDP